MRTASAVIHRRKVSVPAELRLLSSDVSELEAAPALATVSVVITCFNYARFLAEAVTSALSQSNVEVDVVIVDDCSADDSVSVAEQLCAADRRVRLIRHRVNRGPVEAFNTGLAQATGEYLVRLDADDLLTPGSIARAVQLAQRFPSVGLIYGHPVHFIDGRERPVARLTPTAWSVWPGAEWVQDRCADARNVITSAEVVMRRSVVDRLGGQLDLAHTHDMEMWLRLASFSDVGYVHGADQAWHRDHDASLSAREVDIARDLAERRLAFATLFDGPAGSLEWAPAARAAVWEQLDRELLELLEHEVDANGGSSATFARLLELEMTPSRRNVIRRGRILQRVARNRGPADHLMSISRRAAARVRRDRAQRNWHQNGEY